MLAKVFWEGHRRNYIVGRGAMYIITHNLSRYCVLMLRGSLSACTNEMQVTDVCRKLSRAMDLQTLARKR